MCHTNTIAMKDLLILMKTKEEEMLSDDIIDTIAPAEVTLISSLVDLAKRYNWVMSNADLNVAKKQGLTSIKKYERNDGQVKMEQD